jgi:hypothetical protein
LLGWQIANSRLKYKFEQEINFIKFV